MWGEPFMTQRSLEDDLMEQDYLKLDTDFAKGIRYGVKKERDRVKILIRKLQGDSHALHVLYKILEEEKEELYLGFHKERVRQGFRKLKSGWVKRRKD